MAKAHRGGDWFFCHSLSGVLTQKGVLVMGSYKAGIDDLVPWLLVVAIVIVTLAIVSV